VITGEERYIELSPSVSIKTATRKWVCQADLEKENLEERLSKVENQLESIKYVYVLQYFYEITIYIFSRNVHKELLTIKNLILTLTETKKERSKSSQRLDENIK